MKKEIKELLTQEKQKWLEEIIKKIEEWANESKYKIPYWNCTKEELGTLKNDLIQELKKDKNK